MERDDVKKLIGIMVTSYPNYKPQDMKMTVDIWHEMLQDYLASDVFIALKSYIASDTSGFAPSIGQLINMICKMTKPQLMNEHEAWSLVRKALENGIYNSQKEFDNLPEAVQRAVGDANQLYVWATDMDYDESVISSNFMRAYRTVCARQEEYNRMPKEAQLRLESLRAQALGQKGQALLNDSQREISLA